MSDGQAVYLDGCSMLPDQAAMVSQMIASHGEFSGIEIIVNSDRGTYDLIQAERIWEGEVLVIFRIPQSVCHDFYTELGRALNQESTAAMLQKEREG